jgi:hypothetical protein
MSTHHVIDIPDIPVSNLGYRSSPIRDLACSISIHLGWSTAGSPRRSFLLRDPRQIHQLNHSRPVEVIFSPS